MLPRGTANIYPFVSSGLREGLSGAAILRSMRSAGLGLRTQDFYRILGEAKAEFSAESVIESLEPHQYPPTSEIGTWGAAPGNKGYMHIVNFTRLDRVTHLPETSAVVIKSPDLLTRGEAEATAQEILEANERKYPDKRVISFNLSAVRELVAES